ncbi:Biopolymer transport protein ExbD/TolR [Desulfatibacillum aliphaticivorans]|jgi:biopolymer transport protein ExbD|uniref:Biopolymer transport protein ExbD/TolR n=2 Tax=Desulfatibacillum TaxID=218207 RepID=B8FGQ7_DESAL|nr:MULTISPECIES: biopolymer transporter ExbD [Desulfatibacillum]ACL05287.1 Biopolymer transport protein ExbD/TolR [Desulfatibacillum aliphaticivorans]SHJ49788.1 outer membrane transport energization protein ExbD [Desulfatibacillum alkenivorans DSM 16219]
MLNITASRRNKGQGVELNIAPLIDMVFILLIFFLVTTSFVRETGVDVERPSAATAVTKNQSSILIAVTRDNRVFMEKRELDPRTVRANVERALAENPEAGVVVVADKESMTGMVIEVMDECRLAGAKNVSIAASLDSGG